MIKSIEDKTGKIEIDLTGPDGNALILIATAKEIAKNINKTYRRKRFDPDEIAKDMRSGDYEHLLSVMEKHFGNLIIMYR